MEPDRTQRPGWHPARWLPFGLRVEARRLARGLRRLPARSRAAVERRPVAGFGHRLAAAESPLERVPGAQPPALQRGKEINVALACRAIDGVVLAPGAVFSYHRLVGRPSRLRGFRVGLELQDSRESAGVGGGCCQVSNMLFQLAVCAGLDIVERHRHGFDLFPDQQRSVPFGFGATVFYNYRDLRFANPLQCALRIALALEDRSAADRADAAAGRDWVLVGAIAAAADCGRRVEVFERDQRFFVQHGRRMRENRICRRITDRRGRIIEDRELAHNRCRVLY